MQAAPSFWQTFTAAPHRVMFLAGALQGVFTLLWWLADLLARYGGWYAPVSWTLPPAWAHGFLMIYTFFPFFIFGFLLTAVPSWLETRPVQRPQYLPPFLAMAGGTAVFYVGLWTSTAVVGVGVALLAAGLALVLRVLLGLRAASTQTDKRHATVVISALAAGVLCCAAYAAWLVFGQTWLARAALYGGVWLFLLPIFLTVCHRMVPFFSSRVLQDYTMYRPYWALYVMVAAAVGHGVLEIAGARQFLWLADLPLAVTGLHLSTAWGIERSFGVKLLAVLHVAFLWVGLSASLGFLQSVLLLFRGVDFFGLGPLHALTIGLFGSMVIGMASRVTLGHSGRPLVADAATWGLFLSLQAAAVLRVAGSMKAVSGGLTAFMSIAAGLVWLLAFVAWSLKYAPAYTRPRIDGKPG